MLSFFLTKFFSCYIPSAIICFMVAKVSTMQMMLELLTTHRHFFGIDPPWFY